MQVSPHAELDMSMLEAIDSIGLTAFSLIQSVLAADQRPVMRAAHAYKGLLLSCLPFYDAKLSSTQVVHAETSPSCRLPTCRSQQ